MNHEDAVATARAFPHAQILPVHHHGWEHFSETEQDVVNAFSRAGLMSQLRLLTPGVAQRIEVGSES